MGDVTRCDRSIAAPIGWECCMSDSAAGQGGSGLPAGHPLKPISQGHDETSAALPAQQPSAPACFPPAWPVQLGTLTGHWAGCASLGCGSRSQALRVTVWGHGWLWRKLKAVHCWYFWVWCHVIPILWQLAWSVAEGCVQPFREGAGLAAEVVTFHLCSLSCGPRWLEGQVRAKCCGEHGQAKPCVPPQQKEEQRDANSDARVYRMGQG